MPSLVGSEMCIRDRGRVSVRVGRRDELPGGVVGRGGEVATRVGLLDHAPGGVVGRAGRVAERVDLLSQAYNVRTTTLVSFRAAIAPLIHTYAMDTRGANRLFRSAHRSDCVS